VTYEGLTTSYKKLLSSLAVLVSGEVAPGGSLQAVNILAFGSGPSGADGQVLFRANLESIGDYPGDDSVYKFAERVHHRYSDGTDPSPVRAVRCGVDAYSTGGVDAA